MASNLFNALFRRTPTTPAFPPKFPYPIKNNPYRAKRPWPPDFSQLSQKHQFRLERRYRRRSKLKWARPAWVKGVQIAQWGAIVFVVGYGVFYLEVEDEKMGRGGGGGEGGVRRTVFDGVREWWGEQFGSLGSPREGGRGGSSGQGGASVGAGGQKG